MNVKKRVLLSIFTSTKEVKFSDYGLSFCLSVGRLTQKVVLLLFLSIVRMVKKNLEGLQRAKNGYWGIGKPWQR